MSNFIMQINNKNLINNIKSVKRIRKNCKFCAVVKANAYGHKISNIVPIIKDYVDFFAVANFEEATEVLKYTSKPILILCSIDKEKIEECIINNVRLSVSNFFELKRINQICEQLHKKAYIHLAVNTGMNRLGFLINKLFFKAVEYVYSCKFLVLEGIYSHFYDSENKEILEMQYNKFLKLKNEINNKNIIFHIASSDSAACDEKYCLDMIRIGILMYGYANKKYIKNIKPILELKSNIVHIQSVKKGENVSYGQSFIARKNMKIAVLPFGYADGYNRLLSNKIFVKINNTQCRQIGNVCMDLTLIDVTNINCKIGDEVTVLDEEINAEFLAKICHTISYEILTSFKL